MMFILKIFGIMTFAAANVTAYIVLSFMVFGMKPEYTVEYVKMKFYEVTSDSLAYTAQTGLEPEVAQSESEQAEVSIFNERKEIEEQKQQLDKDKNDLEKMRVEVEQLMSQKHQDAEDRMYELAKIYDGMDQENVADVFSKMSDTLVVAILPKMKPKNASKVLEYLSSERSAELSRKMLKGM